MSSPSAFTRRKFLISSAAAASSAWLLAACGGRRRQRSRHHAGLRLAGPQAEIDQALDTETTLTFWTWVPDITNQVKMFTTKYPKIKVNVVNVGQGAPHYQKLRTAIQSGQGGTGRDADGVPVHPVLHPRRAGQPARPDAVRPGRPPEPSTRNGWGQVKVNNGLWGIPQDTGPMGLLYRNDLFSDAGIEPPATWDDFAAAAETYHTKNPKSWLVNVAQNQPGQLVAYLWQVGQAVHLRRPGDGEGRLANDQAQGRGQVLRRPGEQRTGHLRRRLQRLLVPGAGERQGRPCRSPRGVRCSSRAPPARPRGRRANALPQWKAGENVSSNWGGSTDAVLKLSKNHHAEPAGPLDQHRQGRCSGSPTSSSCSRR